MHSATAESGPRSTHCFHGRKQAAQEGFYYITSSSQFNWEVLREREENIFNPGKTLCLILQVLLYLLFWICHSRSHMPSRTSGPGCERDVPFAQVVALALFSLGVTI